MGLFDALSAQTPQGAQLRSGLLGMASGLLSGSTGNYGQFGPALGQGFAGFAAGTQGERENQIREQQLGQLGHVRQLQAQKLQNEVNQQQGLNDFLNPSGPQTFPVGGTQDAMKSRIDQAMSSPNPAIREWGFKMRSAMNGGQGMSGLVPTAKGYAYRKPDGSTGYLTGPDGNPLMPASLTAQPQKPLPSTALKMQTENLDAIGTLSSINSDLNALYDKIDSGKLDLGPIDNATSATLNATGLSTENSRNYASFRSTLEKLRNDSLRLNNGVQTEGDAQRAWNELISNINDPKLVMQRLKEIQRINERAARLRALSNDQMLANFGRDPMDYSKYFDQPSALSDNAAGGAIATPSGKAEFDALPSGSLFRDPTGKVRRKP